MNVIAARCSQANKTSQHIKTCHMRHIFMPGNETIKKLFPSCNNLLNATFQSHPIKIGCCNRNNQCLTVPTINPIWHSCPVHHGTNFQVLISLKSKENNRNMSKSKGWTLQSSLLTLWMDENSNQQSNKNC